MLTVKKTIVLSNKTNLNSNCMAVLTLENMKSGVFGTLKAYNISDSNNLLLGISCNNKPILKQNINLKNNNSYNFKLNSNFDMSGHIGCVLVIDAENAVVPIVWGTTDKESNYKSEIVRNLNSVKYDKKNFNVETHSAVSPIEKKPVEKPKDLAELFNLPNGEELDDLIDSHLNQESEKEFLETLKKPVHDFYKNTENIAVDMSELKEKTKHKNIIETEYDEQKSDLEDGKMFFDLVKDQIEDLFSKYPNEEALENLIPNSKWVRIDYEGDGNYYVLGLIYEDVSLKYICYGVPGDFSKEPPKDMAAFSQWLPINPNAPDDGGYWVMYQDALTGDSIEIDAI